MTILGQLSETQAEKATTVNELFEAVARAGLFGIRRPVTAALTFAFYGGQVWVNGVLTTIANGTVALTGSATNYVEATAAGVVSANTTGFTAGRLPLYEVTTSASAITGITDRRITNARLYGFLSKSVAGSSNVTLTAAEARNSHIKLTGTLTGNIDVILPAVVGVWTIENATSGAFTLTVKAAGGAGVTIAQQAAAHILWGDGTNIYRAGGEQIGGAANQVVFRDSGGTPTGNANLTFDGDRLHVQNQPVPIAQGGITKNAIIGGDFSTNPWQRGTSFAAVASTTYTADRWQYLKSGDMVHTISRAADAPTVAQAGALVTHCLLVDCTTADTSIAAAEFCLVQTIIEGFNFLRFAQRTLTLSFWHKHTKTGTYCVAFQNSGVDRSYIAEYTQTVSNTWEKTTITVPDSPAAGTWDYINGAGLRVRFALAQGSNNQGIANEWLSENARATSNQVNATDSTDNDFRLALVQLEAGSVATEFEYRNIREVLADCQRYLPAVKALSGAPVCTGMCISATSSRIIYPLRVTPRTAPTGLTVSAASHFGPVDKDGASIPGSSLTFGAASGEAVNIVLDVASGLVAGNGTFMVSRDNSAQILFTGCEL